MPTTLFARCAKKTKGTVVISSEIGQAMQAISESTFVISSEAAHAMQAISKSIFVISSVIAKAIQAVLKWKQKTTRSSSRR